MKGSLIKQLNATGDVTTASTYLRSVSLTGGSDAATATVKAGGSGGTTVLTVKAAANTTVEVPVYDAYCAGGVHVTFAGTGPVASFVYAV